MRVEDFYDWDSATICGGAYEAFVDDFSREVEIAEANSLYKVSPLKPPLVKYMY